MVPENKGKALCIPRLCSELTHNPRQTQNDYLREWELRKHQHLDILLDRLGRGDNASCSVCQATDATWQCASCFHDPLFCTGCMRESHGSLPFHRVEQWDGACSKPAWLADVGVAIYLGHGGKMCPTYLTNTSLASASGSTTTPAGAEDTAEDTAEAEPTGSGDEADDEEEDPDIAQRWKSSFDRTGNYTRRNGVCVVIDTNGVHCLNLRPCQCTGAEPAEHQCLRAGLYPASFTRIKDRKSTRLNSSHSGESRMPSSA